MDDIELLDDENSNEGEFKENARIKAALYHTIGKICDAELVGKDKTFSKEYLASLAEVVFAQGELFANDMETFCRHSKRTIVNMDDVKLIARKNKTLSELLEQYGKKISEEQKNKVRGKKRKTDHVVLDDDD